MKKQATGDRQQAVVRARRAVPLPAIVLVLALAFLSTQHSGLSTAWASTGCSYPTSLDVWTDKVAGDFWTVADVNQARCGIEKLMTGPIRPNKGSVAAPSYSWQGDSDSGIDSLAADSGALIAAGAEIAGWTSTQLAPAAGKHIVASKNNCASAGQAPQNDGTCLNVTADTQIFTGSGTWTKPAGAKQVYAFLVGGGAGGGSGRRGATSTARGGGGSGGGGARSTGSWPASILGATESITIGAAGSGGAAVSVNDTNGNAGADAGSTSLGSWLVARGGLKGSGGVTTVGASGNGGTGLYDGSTAGNDSSAAAAAGGKGASFISDNSVIAGGDGGAGSNKILPTPLAGGGAGTAGISGATGANAATNQADGGGGGGGGGQGAAGPAGAGGNGGNYGAGAGGGGASLNGNNSGAGGNGAPGIAIIVTVF